MKTTSFTIRMTPDAKERIEDFFEELGVTLSCSVRILMEKSILDGRIPFDVKRVRENEYFFPEMDLEPEGVEKTEEVTFTVDSTKYSQFKYVCDECGISVEEAIMLYYKLCWHMEGIPFRVGYPRPNTDSLVAIWEDRDMRLGKRPMRTYSSVEEMVESIMSSGDEEDAEYDKYVESILPEIQRKMDQWKDIMLEW